jgi:peptidoglycan/xylan/chitin deacetylase (PgdA/CDA1 family)
MTAKFIISFDCEGKWGVADHLTKQIHQALNNVNLLNSYKNIVSMLDKFDIPATFAFVGCFSVSEPELKSIEPALIELAQIFPHYLGKALTDYRTNSSQGWIGNWALDLIKLSRLNHEIGLHGVTHIPWDDPLMTEEHARQELSILYNANSDLIHEISTYIYPRNAIAYPHLLAEQGIIGYREGRARTSRLNSLLAEFNVFAKPDKDLKHTIVQAIPAGFFVNWKYGARAYVPLNVSRIRARMLLRRAYQESALVHFWTHPENFATAPGTLNVLKAILEEVVTMRDKGLCQIFTQKSYCEALREKARGTA